MFGAICSGKFADKVGPKTAQIVNAVPFIIGAVLSAVSPHRHVGFLAGRVISGLGKWHTLSAWFVQKYEHTKDKQIRGFYKLPWT